MGLSEFLHMGGYGAFIWSSYGVSAVVLLALTILSLRQLKAIERALIPLEENRRTQRRRSKQGKVAQ
jgi:heme exporter protein D